jgi:hypothetical protein
VKEFVEASYKRIIDMLIVPIAEKLQRDEEEKMFLEQEKDIMIKDKPDIPKDKKRDGDES